MKKYDFAIVGGDKRTACMASVFAGRGFRVICFGTTEHSVNEKIHAADTIQEVVGSASTIICGIPFEKNGNLFFEAPVTDIPLTELKRLLRKNYKLFGGVIPEDFKRVCEKRNIGCYDFMEEEPLSIYNAVATAEGAILEALLHKDTKLHHSNVLVLGYGRCGRILAHKLAGLSAHVTVGSAQSQELALASSLGSDTLALANLPDEIGRFEYIFNTIPATVLTKPCLEQADSNCLIIDIASNRIGVDYESACLLQRHAIFCPGLPGKYTSQSCAEQLCEFVMKKM